MATMPTRAGTFDLAFKSIIHQVDKIYLYLDGHDAVPPVAAGHPKVVHIYSRDIPNLRGSGKFLALNMEPGQFYFFGVDDDIYYTYDYANALERGLSQRQGRVVVGLHGALLSRPLVGYRVGRTSYRFQSKLRGDQMIDVIGTGTCAFDTAHLRFDVQQWAHANMNDLHLSLEAASRGLELISLARKSGLAFPLAYDQPDSIFHVLRTDDSAQTEVARGLLDLQTQLADGPLATKPHPASSGQGGPDDAR